jgi:hypothetical protein
LLQVHPLVISEDLPNLPMILRIDFEGLFKPILQSTPDTGGILSCHKLKGDLRGYYALEIPLMIQNIGWFIGFLKSLRRKE